MKVRMFALGLMLVADMVVGQEISSGVTPKVTSQLLKKLNACDSNNIFRGIDDSSITFNVKAQNCVRVFSGRYKNNIESFDFKTPIYSYLSFDTIHAVYYFYDKNVESYSIKSISGSPFTYWYPIDHYDISEIEMLLKKNIDLQESFIFRFGMINKYFIKTRNQVLVFNENELMDANEYFLKIITPEKFWKILNPRF